MKTNKSFMKRVKLTKNGKLKTRKAGQNHFNAKASRSSQLDKKRSATLVLTNKDRSRFITSK
jgi:ribosomal protein L35